MEQTRDAAAVVRDAFAALQLGDGATMLELVDADVEWTYLDPSAADPVPQVCRGRDELRRRMARPSARAMSATIEEMEVIGDRVIVVTPRAAIAETRTPPA